MAAVAESIVFEPKKRATALLYAEKRLSDWADWAKANREGLGFPSVSLLYRAMRERLEPERRKADEMVLGPNERAKLPTALGTQQHVFVATRVDASEAVLEVDAVVMRLPRDLKEVIFADYFTYGPIEVRAKKTRWKRARYSQLLESAKYSVFAALDSRTLPAIQD